MNSEPPRLPRNKNSHDIHWKVHLQQWNNVSSDLSQMILVNNTTCHQCMGRKGVKRGKKEKKKHLLLTTKRTSGFILSLQDGTKLSNHPQTTPHPVPLTQVNIMQSWRAGVLHGYFHTTLEMTSSLNSHLAHF